ncbi:MAG: hypothetical protein CMD84_05135 [Gammaproteobacteria bacterium]|jgi:UPF0176 protein|nr:hypothetical protein [Gammaproteobacteria bacterium]|tara:strand:- start:8417 stop:9118 length:702 start_codon:yes stop_codon:yes gene_type:complete
MHKKINTIISFYKFIKVEDTNSLRHVIFDYLEGLGILGTILIANEGINVNLCGGSYEIELSKKFITEQLDLGLIHSNESNIDYQAFSKLKVKIKKEIIKVGLKISENDINKNEYLNPKQWDNLLDDKPIVLDTRNRFEYLLGTFENAKSLDLDSFSDFKEKVIESKRLDKKQDIAIFCTGGIRCEKASVILKNLGFENVFQLKGGIINYLNHNKNIDSKWKGDCFVFDDRITL